MLRMLTFRSYENITSNMLIKAYGLEEFGIKDCPPEGMWLIDGTTPIKPTDYVPFNFDTTPYDFICITPTLFRWSMRGGVDLEIKNIDKHDRTFIKAFNHLNSLPK